MADESENENELESKILKRLEKTVIVKHIPSDKQKSHIEKLAKAKKGTKYQKIEPVEVQPTKTKAKPKAKVVEEIEEESESIEEQPKVIVKKKSKKPVIIYQSETESSEEQIIIKKKKEVVPKKKAVPKKKPVVKKPVKKADSAQPEPEPSPPSGEQPISRFRSRIC